MQRLSRHHSGAMTDNPAANSSAPPDDGIEFGNQDAALDAVAENRSALVLASYNIRYAVGKHLISSGLLRKAGLNFPRNRAVAVARNIQMAARALSDGT